MHSLSNGETQPLLVNVRDLEYHSTPQSEQASSARQSNGFFTTRESRIPSCEVSVGLLILGLLTTWISPFSSDEMNNIVGGGLFVFAAVFACMECCSETCDEEIEASFRLP